VKSEVEATKTVILTMRRIFSSDRQVAALAWARMLTAQAELRRLLAGGDVEVAAEQAGDGELAVLERQLAGGEDEIAASP
jgi:hypothetical protein